jgi:predicted TIM-barrel fold metal-dependent hydrolase
MSRALVISADCHASASPQKSLGTAIAPQDAEPGVSFPVDPVAGILAYRDYFDSRHLAALDEHCARIRAAQRALVQIPRIGGDDDMLRRQIDEREDFMEQRFGVRERPAGDWDPERRAKELEADGVVADVIFPNGGPALGLVGADVELLHAGEMAYNRWLADFCAHDPGRHAGVGIVSVEDLDTTLETVRWVRDHGLFGGIVLPNDAATHRYSDERYDRLWAMCADLEVVVNIHGSPAGMPQYPARGFADIWWQEIAFYCHRPFWWLMWSGAFERHPALKFAIVEQGAYWLPEMLEDMDNHARGVSVPGRRPTAWTPDLASELELLPSEYFRRQCFINWAIGGGSSTLEEIQKDDSPVLVQCRSEVGMRAEIGVTSMMWGNDYPHAESTWPHSVPILDRALAGVPSDDRAKLVGLNAARCYGFDLDRLAPLAARVGPDLL